MVLCRHSTILKTVRFKSAIFIHVILCKLSRFCIQHFFSILEIYAIFSKTCTVLFFISAALTKYVLLS